MHKLTLSAPVNLGRQLGVLEPGAWLVNDVNAFEIAQMAPRGAATLEDFAPKVDFGDVADMMSPLPDDAAVLIVRCGAWGDLLLLEPALRAYKKKWPDRRVALACFPHHFEMTAPWMEPIRYPVPISVLSEFDEVIDLADAELVRDKHMTDVFAEKLGVTVTDYKPIFLINELRVRPRTNSKRPVIGLCPSASVANRRYPLDKTAHLIGGLLTAGWEVWIFGKDGQFPQLKPNPHIRDISRESKSFQDSASWLNICDAFIGVDSALIHLCHALSVPALGLYAAFPWTIRTSHAPLTRAISGVGACAPCFHHMHAGRQFPEGQPCEAAGFCTVLGGIEPAKIVAAAEKLKP